MPDSDRRKPLGGVDKETFVHSAEDAKHHAELTYNLLTGMKSDICHSLDKMKSDMDEIKTTCGCRMEDCGKKFLRKVNEKIPFSLAELVIIALFVGILVGLGYLEWREVVKIKIGV